MRQSRLSGSVEGVMGNHDSYSDSFLKQIEMIHSEKFSELADAHRQNSSRGSGSSDHYCCACDACWAHMSLLSFLSTTLRASRNFLRALRYESCELALKRLGYASAPAIGN